MSEKKKGSKPSTGGVVKKYGYQPLGEGYQPSSGGKKGYTPTQGSGSSTPKPPKGGTGQSSGSN